MITIQKLAFCSFQRKTPVQYLYRQKHHNEYKNCRTLPSVFLLCDCQKKSLENSGTQLRTSRKGSLTCWLIPITLQYRKTEERALPLIELTETSNYSKNSSVSSLTNSTYQFEVWFLRHNRPKVSTHLFSVLRDLAYLDQLRQVGFHAGFPS